MAGLKDERPPPRLGTEVELSLAVRMPTLEGKECIERCVEALTEVVKLLGPRWRAEPFGSVRNGFGTNTSDLDATCYLVDKEGPDGPDDEEDGQGGPQPAACVLRERLAPLLRQRPEFVLAEEVFGARVPILKLRFEDRLEVDISCHNTKALQNTKLLKAYAGLDRRVRDLGVAVKLWAKAAQVSGASRSHLSSYTFTLLVIYFLQVSEETRLPKLPCEAFENGALGEEDPRVKAATPWPCSLSLEKLVVLFFRFYAEEFFWGSEVASIRLGTRSGVQDPAFQELRGRKYAHLHVEDPFDVTRNLNCVLAEPEERQLRAAVRDAHLVVRSGRAPVGLTTPVLTASRPREPQRCGRREEAPPRRRSVAAEESPRRPPQRGGSGGAAAPARSSSEGSAGSFVGCAASAASTAGSTASPADSCPSPATTSRRSWDEALSSEGDQELPQATPVGPPLIQNYIECSDLEAALTAPRERKEHQACWWHHLGSEEVKRAVEATAPQREECWRECAEVEAAMALPLASAHARGERAGLAERGKGALGARPGKRHRKAGKAARSTASFAGLGILAQ